MLKVEEWQGNGTTDENLYILSMYVKKITRDVKRKKKKILCNVGNN